MTYLDYQATTPLAPEALAAMLPWLGDNFANPASAHAAGRAARGGGGGGARPGRGPAAREWRGRFHRRRDRGAQLGDQGHDRRRGHAGERACRRARHRRGSGAARAHGDGGARRQRRAGRFPSRARGDPARRGAGRGDAGQQRDRHDPAGRAARGAGACRGGAVPVRRRPGLCAASASPRNATWSRFPRTRSTAPRASARCGFATGWRSSRCSTAAGRSRAGDRARSRRHCARASARRRSSPSSASAPTIRTPASFSTRAFGAMASRGWTLNGSRGERYPGNLNIRLGGLDVARLMSDLRDIAFSAGSACAERLGAAEPCAARRSG